MIVQLHKTGKRFTNEWIFKNLSYTFEQGKQYAILGPNGSGKSTLLQVLAGSITPTAGSVTYFNRDKPVEVEQVFKYMGYSGPYIQLPEELTLTEVLTFHASFKPFVANLQIADVLAVLQLQPHANRELRYFSSGMKQRVKLALSILPANEMILLDEPATNLDSAGTAWYRGLLDTYLKQRLLVVSSNRPEEYAMCTEHLTITDFK